MVGVSGPQSWPSEDYDVHQPLSVWARGGSSILWKLLFFCGAPLSSCHGEFSVMLHFCVYMHMTWGNDKLMMGTVRYGT